MFNFQDYIVPSINNGFKEYNYEEIPSEFEVSKTGSYLTARCKDDYLYYCKYCRGWVSERPIEIKKDTNGIFGRRVGQAVCCRNCDGELDFNGEHHRKDGKIIQIRDGLPIFP